MTLTKKHENGERKQHLDHDMHEMEPWSQTRPSQGEPEKDMSGGQTPNADREPQMRCGWNDPYCHVSDASLTLNSDVTGFCCEKNTIQHGPYQRSSFQTLEEDTETERLHKNPWRRESISFVAREAQNKTKTLIRMECLTRRVSCASPSRQIQFVSNGNVALTSEPNLCLRHMPR